MSVALSAVCGALGCTADATVVINHSEHGERVVCPEHADDGEVVGDV